MAVLRLLVVVLALASLSCADSFDKPLAKKTIDLGPSRSTPKTHAKVTCYFFSSFMVKEVDLGEKGAARLSILPTTKGTASACTRSQAKSEKVIDPKEWTGYFKGAKNNFVFFDADDGVTGGVGFAVSGACVGTEFVAVLIASGEARFSAARAAGF